MGGNGLRPGALNRVFGSTMPSSPRGWLIAPIILPRHAPHTWRSPPVQRTPGVPGEDGSVPVRRTVAALLVAFALTACAGGEGESEVPGADASGSAATSGTGPA